MRVVKIPVQHQSSAVPTPKKKRGKRAYFGVVVVVLSIVQLCRPLPAAEIKLALPTTIPGKDTTLALPAYGQSAVTVKDYGLVATSGAQTQLSTASIAKVITALCVLERKPLQPGQKGPSITMTRRDVELYQQEVAQNGSRVQVYEGQKMSEYMALQAIMIPSANNIANTLAEWAFGSLEEYSAYANNFVMRHGLVNTRIGTDASGYDPSTASSASDLARLGVIAEANPVLMEIAGQASATFPLSGQMTNYNTILGKNGITGLKTGNNEQNPGALLWTGKTSVANRTLQFAGAVAGASDLAEALESSRMLAASLPQNFEKLTIAHAEQVVGRLTTQWGSTADIVFEAPVSIVRYRGDAITIRLTTITTDGVTTKKIGVAAINVNSSTVSKNLILRQPAQQPSLVWRLTRLR